MSVSKFITIFLPSLLLTFSIIPHGVQGQSCRKSKSVTDPSQYFDAVVNKNLSSDDLRMKLNQIIKDTHTCLSYSCAKTPLAELDESQTDSGSVTGFYSRKDISKSRRGNGSDKWNNEHIFPAGRWGRGDERCPYGDLHNLVATTASVNSDRSNDDFDEVGDDRRGNSNVSDCDGCKEIEGEVWEPPSDQKGQVARILFYMDVRYSDDETNLRLVRGRSNKSKPELGNLETLLKWHCESKVSPAEKDRNNGVQEWQGNRNPFVDYPAFVETIFGACPNGSVHSVDTTSQPSQPSQPVTTLPIDENTCEAEDGTCTSSDIGLPPIVRPITKENVYQQIWDADQNGNGIPAILSADTVTPRDKGYVIVNETPNFNPDTKVFPEVVIPENKLSTYTKFKDLINNYFIDEDKREDAFNETENIEINTFIDAIYDTQPMKIAREYLDPSQSDEDWKISIKEKWFTAFGSNDRSGFEHVFVGENSGSVSNNIGGYHFWYKYYIDDNGQGKIDGKDTIDYLGVAYSKYDQGKKNTEGRKVPEVVTMKFKWTPEDEATKEKFDLEKPVGGFWVGCSPEGLIALGMARFKEATKDTTDIVINNVEYKLILYTGGIDDKIIDTFYPKFNRIIKSSGPGPSGPTPSGPPSGSVIIVSALVNPAVEDVGNERVTLKNSSPVTVDITNWKIVDKNGGEFELSAAGLTELEAGQEQSITLPGTGRKPAQLSNKGGKIILKDGDGDVIDEVSYSRGQAKQGVEVKF